MRNVLAIAATAALTLGLMTGSFGSPKGKAAAALKCPVCKMTLSTKKTDAMPRAVKIKGKTYYCCSACDMSKMGKGGAKKAPTKNPS